MPAFVATDAMSTCAFSGENAVVAVLVADAGVLLALLAPPGMLVLAGAEATITADATVAAGAIAEAAAALEATGGASVVVVVVGLAATTGSAARITPDGTSRVGAVR
jgi:hypothetical protein